MTPEQLLKTIIERRLNETTLIPERCNMSLHHQRMYSFEEFLQDVLNSEAPTSLSPMLEKLHDILSGKGYHLSDILQGLADFVKQEFQGENCLE